MIGVLVLVSSLLSIKNNPGRIKLMILAAVPPWDVGGYRIETSVLYASTHKLDIMNTSYAQNKYHNRIRAIKPKMIEMPGISKATIRAEPDRRSVNKKCSNGGLSVENTSSSTSIGNPSRDMWGTRFGLSPNLSLSKSGSVTSACVGEEVVLVSYGWWSIDEVLASSRARCINPGQRHRQSTHVKVEKNL